MYPSVEALISKWAPPTEKSWFAASLMGHTLGTAITFPLLGVILDRMKWMWAFFIPGTLAILWGVIWLFTVADSPIYHRWITEEEKTYITNSLYVPETVPIQKAKVIFK